MAEYICGNEQEFVNQMNERAKGLGMENTHFVNCNGLDAEGHVTTARDIALMSRELIHTYPQIFVTAISGWRILRTRRKRALHSLDLQIRTK